MADETNNKGVSMANNIAKTEKAGLPVSMEDIEKMAGAGFEEATADSYAIPFMQILQKMSDQTDPGHASYIEGGKAGMFANLTTTKIYDGKKGILVIPCHYSRKFVEWVPREKGGGLRGLHSPDSDVVQNANPDPKNPLELLTDEGNLLKDTRYHFVLNVTDGSPEPVIFTMKSSQIKKSRAWMTRMQNLTMARKDGTRFKAPMFSHIWNLTTKQESNDRGSWYGLFIEGEPTVISDMSLFKAAQEFRDMAMAGDAKISGDPNSPDDSQSNSQF
jgi:hypothetical protein|tara:strand:- start:6 stop:827 length:822 start_codon:yes stop_codon:yes gene_type:complete